MSPTCVVVGIPYLMASDALARLWIMSKYLRSGEYNGCCCWYPHISVGTASPVVYALFANPSNVPAVLNVCLGTQLTGASPPRLNPTWLSGELILCASAARVLE